jgi:hypothetical protein
MDSNRYDDQRSGRARAVLARANELRAAFSKASSDSERNRLFQEMQKLNLEMHTFMKHDVDDYYEYDDYENDHDLLDAYEDDLIDYYDDEDDVDFDADDFLY